MDVMDQLANILNKYVTKIWIGSTAQNLKTIENDAEKIQTKFFRQLYTLGFFGIRHTPNTNNEPLKLPNSEGLNIAERKWASFTKDHLKRKKNKKYRTHNVFFRYKGLKGKTKRFKALEDSLKNQDPRKVFGKPSVALITQKGSVKIKREQLNNKGNLMVKAYWADNSGSLTTKEFEVGNTPITDYRIDIDLYPNIPQDYTEESIASKLKFSTPVVRWKLFNKKTPRYFMARYMEWYAERYVAQRLLRKVT